MKLLKKQICSYTLETGPHIFCCLEYLYHLPLKRDNLSLLHFLEVIEKPKDMTIGFDSGRWLLEQDLQVCEMMQDSLRVCLVRAPSPLLPFHQREDRVAGAPCTAWCSAPFPSPFCGGTATSISQTTLTSDSPANSTQRRLLPVFPSGLLLRRHM